MSFFETRININGIRNILNAVENLQEAGEYAQANAALKSMCDKINAELPEIKKWPYYEISASGAQKKKV